MTKKIIILGFIILFGFVLRFWNVAKIPPGLNRDEASIGYTAYSLFKTGKDEYGNFLPLSIKSFGDWKLPLYIYLDIVPVSFSLDELAIRLPSVIFGTATILVVYLLCIKIFKDRKEKYLLALASSFLLAISPWHIHFSRVVSEANMAVFLVSLALLLFIIGMTRPLILFLSSFVFALSLYTYHANHIFTPLLVCGLIIILIKKKTDKYILAIFMMIYLILSLIIYQKTLFSADRTKISGLTPLTDQYLVYEKISLARLEHTDPESVLPKIFHNKPSFVFGRFIEGYWRSFSTDFLYIKGGANLQHNIPNFGNLYIWETPFLVLGLYFIFRKKYPWRFLLLYWLLIAPIPAAITKDAPHSARMLSILPIPHIFSAVGLIELFSVLKNTKLKNIFIYTAIFLLVINFSLYLDRYFTHFPYVSEEAWGGGYKDLVSEVASLSGNYQEIVMDRPNYSPYIYFLFYQKYDPSSYQNEVIRYPVDEEGFHHVERVGNLIFKKLDWDSDLSVPGRLIISWCDQVPSSMVQRLIKTIKLKNDKPQFCLLE